MKNIFLITSILFSSYLYSAKGDVLRLKTNCFQDNGSIVSCEFCNDEYDSRLLCFMRLSGMSSDGTWYKSKKSKVVLPGKCFQNTVAIINKPLSSIVKYRSNVRCQVQ